MGLLSRFRGLFSSGRSSDNERFIQELFVRATHLANELRQGDYRFHVLRGGERNNRLIVELEDPAGPDVLLAGRGLRGWKIARIVFDVGVTADFRGLQRYDESIVFSVDDLSRTLRSVMLNTRAKAMENAMV